MDKQPVRNKDLILREQLAIERTVMANDRTLLSFIRTAMYFAVAGLTFRQLVPVRNGLAIAVALFAAAAFIFITGTWKYLHQLRKIRESRRHIGNYLVDASA